MFPDIRQHLLIAPAVRDLAGCVLNQLVGAVARFAVFTIHQRIGEAAYMARSDPYLRIHQNRRIKPHIVRRFLYEFFPPRALDVVLKFNAQRAVVP